ncbi:SAM-dependent methyltransferase [Nafulsella turpanensis]|uniref:SAM-dependent methyltransferase n=1 Tax=Nafulsella turpanensis TaxID=1265690 RepID=UPI000347257F|nr:SAM-dependent methyltransferase [Nafulsella turpanensis]
MNKIKGKLFLIPSVIAENTAGTVLSGQVYEVCRNTTFYLAENIRTARRFISSLELGISIPELQFSLLDKKTPDAEVAALMQPLLQGKDVGVLSEAGCPGVADPGARAVAWAHKNGVQVVPLVGPSSILLALMASGMSGQHFAFHGYLPVKSPEKVQAIRQLEKQAQQGQTQIFMETPYRNNQLLSDLLQHCHPASSLCVASGVTGEGEFIRTLSVAEWKKQKVDLHKIPTIFLLGTVKN